MRAPLAAFVLSRAGSMWLTVATRLAPPRAKTSDICINMPAVSRKHAQLSMDDQGQVRPRWLPRFSRCS
jgi:hypothetical protein